MERFNFDEFDRDIGEALADNERVMAWRVKDHELVVQATRDRDKGEWEEHDTPGAV